MQNRSKQSKAPIVDRCFALWCDPRCRLLQSSRGKENIIIIHYTALMMIRDIDSTTPFSSHFHILARSPSSVYTISLKFDACTRHSQHVRGFLPLKIGLLNSSLATVALTTCIAFCFPPFAQDGLKVCAPCPDTAFEAISEVGLKEHCNVM